ncbi:MAG: DMT family transporter [Candidatus Wildermuthbacteria bacterium]|nr:DMT family transporter [Candidatus Wildermuthbacteria bacterium]
MLQKRKGSFFVLFSALLFGSYGIWAVLLGSDFGVFYQGWIRAFLVLLILVPVVYLTKAWKPLTKADLKLYAWCCGFGIFTQAPLYYAFQHSGVGIASLIFFATFLITSYIVGALMLQERTTFIKILSLILALAGLAFTFVNSLGVFSLFALALAVVNGVASGGEVSTTKLVQNNFSALQTSVMVWAAIFITHLPISLLAGETQLIPALTVPWLAMLGFTIAGVLAFWLVTEGFKYVDASIGGLIGLLEVVFAIIFGALVFSEHIYFSTALGAVIIVIAAAMPHIVDMLSKKNPIS